MQKCKTFSKVIFYIQTIVHLCEGSHKKNLPPLITSVFEAEYFVPVSHSYPFSLHCKAENGIISYKWFKNNSKIQTTDQVVVNESSGDISFRKITKDCFGTYHCLAENQHGASVSLFVNIKEAALGVFLGRTNETIKCEMFHHCKIPCSNRPNCEPSKECKIEWKIGMGTVNPVRTSKKIAIDGRGDLHFLYIERSDEGPNYSCGIWNEKIQRLSKGTTYTVEIIGSNATNELKGIWRNTPKAVLGESATLQCIFSGRHVSMFLNS
ncbi:cell adhesion molecule-related/down-regulated by oncogenes [Magallana gigas]|uniref:cell adhesion molecule-related/down-regulated by oncogenes n=1 Tax=Magallana gigas TaxID=29159 RepID=UPI00333F4D7C